jgi:hypothetical protein
MWLPSRAKVMEEAGCTEGAAVSVTRAARPPQRTAGLAWSLWALGMLDLAAVPWMDHLLRQAGRPDFVPLSPDTAPPVLATVSAATVGAVLASRRPRHPVGWLLLALALSPIATAAAAQYLTWGLLVRPGALPAARGVARYYTATGFAALALIGFVLLLTPIGSLPSPRWRWLARSLGAAPVVSLLLVTWAGGSLDPRYQALGGPFELRGLGGVLPIAYKVALAVITVAVVAAAGSLVRRFGRARGVERQQLRWVTLGALLVALAGVVVVAGLVIGIPGATTYSSWAAGVCIAVLPVATGAAILRYRLYDLDHMISRTLAWGLLTLLLGGGSRRRGAAARAAGRGHRRQGTKLGRGRHDLAVAGMFQPTRLRIQRAVDRRFNRRRYYAAETTAALSDRLRRHVDLETLTAELLMVTRRCNPPGRRCATASTTGRPDCRCERSPNLKRQRTPTIEAPPRRPRVTRHGRRGERPPSNEPTHGAGRR